MAKKIIYVITKSNWGGAQRYVFDLATSMKAREYDVSVIFGGHGLLSDKLIEARIPTISFEKMWRDINILEDIKSFFSLIKIFKNEKPAVVHLNSSKIGGLGALAARLAGVKKIVFTVHGFAFNEDRSWLQKKMIACVSWLTILLCTDVICIAKAEYEQALHWPGTKNKLHLIYNGIDTPDFLSKDLAQKELAQILGITAGIFIRKIVIGSIAELTLNKGLEYAITALKNTPQAIYIIMGTGELERRLRLQILENNLEDRVFLAGFVPQAARFLKAFDIFALPSIKEGLPYVILEAGYASLPVVASRVGGISEIITAESGIIVGPRDTKALYDAFTVLSHESKRLQLGEKLHEKMEASFNLDRMVTATAAVYML